MEHSVMAREEGEIGIMSPDFVAAQDLPSQGVPVQNYTNNTQHFSDFYTELALFY